MSEPQPALPCPMCGSSNAPARKKCWFCAWPLDWQAPVRSAAPFQAAGRFPSSGGGAEGALAPPPASWKPGSSVVDFNPATFSLTSLIIVVTLLCVAFGLWRVAPGLSFFVIFLMIPALARTGKRLQQKRAAGEQPTAWDHVSALLSSFLMVIAVLVLTVLALIAALFVVCAVIGFSNFH